jgi:hypothetical protein
MKKPRDVVKRKKCSWLEYRRDENGRRNGNNGEGVLDLERVSGEEGRERLGLDGRLDGASPGLEFGPVPVAEDTGAFAYQLSLRCREGKRSQSMNSTYHLPEQVLSPQSTKTS